MCNHMHRHFCDRELGNVKPIERLSRLKIWRFTFSAALFALWKNSWSLIHRPQKEIDSRSLPTQLKFFVCLCVLLVFNFLFISVTSVKLTVIVIKTFGWKKRGLPEYTWHKDFGANRLSEITILSPFASRRNSAWGMRMTWESFAAWSH